MANQFLFALVGPIRPIVLPPSNQPRAELDLVQSSALGVTLMNAFSFLSRVVTRQT